MTEIPNKMYWMGQDVDTLPRETLVEIIRHLGRDVEAARKGMDSIIEVNRLAREARRRIA